MRPEQEMRTFLEKCDAVWSFGLSNGPCPLYDTGEQGLCAECSFPEGVRWTLGDSEIVPQSILKANDL